MSFQPHRAEVRPHETPGGDVRGWKVVFIGHGEEVLDKAGMPRGPRVIDFPEMERRFEIQDAAMAYAMEWNKVFDAERRLVEEPPTFSSVVHDAKAWAELQRLNTALPEPGGQVISIYDVGKKDEER